MKRKAGSPPIAKGASSNSSSSTTSSSSSESELPTLSTDSTSSKEACDGSEVAVADAAEQPKTPKCQKPFSRSSPGPAPRKKKRPRSQKKSQPNANAASEDEDPAVAVAGEETVMSDDSEAEAEETLQQHNLLPEGPETYQELFAYPRMNALALLQDHPDHESHCANLKTVLRHRLIQHDSYSGLGTASITCKRQLEAMAAVIDERHLD